MNELEGRCDAVDGAKLWFRVWGSGPHTVVLCDGILCEGFVWKYLRPALLARGLRVVHWNYRGHGESDPPRDRDTMTITHMAQDLWRVLDAAQVGRVVIAGHSMGVQVCLEAYRMAPERVVGLALLCGSYGRVTQTFHGTDALAKALPSLRSFAAKFPVLVRGMISNTPPSLALRVAWALGEVDPVRGREEDMRPYFEHLARIDPQVYLTLLEHAGRHSAEDLLHHIDCPTFVLAAGRDSFTPPRLARQMARSIKDAVLLEVADATHTLPIEQPELVNPALLGFLDERVFSAGEALAEIAPQLA
ncbi:MAG: alpha/beta hydrolase [Deltaproteobacteria bacterium]|nr:alpha/beta hydrolase [Deltaproteobacteria bacterium]